MRMFDDDIIIVRETEHELVVLKPKGLSCEMYGDTNGISLISRLKRVYPEARLVQRLDRVTSGLLLIPLSKKAAGFYAGQIKDRGFEKLYAARVQNHPETPISDFVGMHQAYIKEEKGRALIVNAGGKPSFLQILGAWPAPAHPGNSHLLIQLLTGRFHQIRTMCADIGIPLAGDKLYGGAGEWDDFYLESISLSFTDFASGERVKVFCAENPKRELFDKNLDNMLSF